MGSPGESQDYLSCTLVSICHRDQYLKERLKKRKGGRGLLGFILTCDSRCFSSRSACFIAVSLWSAYHAGKTPVRANLPTLWLPGSRKRERERMKKGPECALQRYPPEISSQAPSPKCPSPSNNDGHDHCEFRARDLAQWWCICLLHTVLSIPSAIRKTIHSQMSPHSPYTSQ